MNHDGTDATPTPPEPLATPADEPTRSVAVDAGGVKRLRLGLKAGDAYMQYPRGSNNRPG